MSALVVDDPTRGPEPTIGVDGPDEPEPGQPRHIDWSFEGTFLVCVLATATLCLTLAARRPGWPVGQSLADPPLVQIYAAHFRHGDFLPVWSSSDAYGMGSTVTLYYQRVFFIVAGFIYILLDNSLKATLVTSLGVFMVIGAYGMRKVLGLVTEFRWLAAVGSIGFLLTNWAFTEWLVRGDLAEFTAFMFVPWLLYCCLTLVRDGRLSWLIVPAMVLIVESHSAIGLVSLVVLLVTAVVFLVFHGLAGLRSVATRLVVAAGVTAVVLLPLLLAEARMGKYYDPITVITDETGPFPHNFSRPLSYLIDLSYHWLSRSNSEFVPVQLDFSITALLLIGLATVVYRRATRSRRQSRQPRTEIAPVNRPVVTLLVASLVIYLLLQFKFSIPLYDALSVVKVIAYPYRMMTFIVPLALILAVMVADWYLRAYKARWPEASRLLPAGLAGLWLLSFVLFSPVTAHEPPAASDSIFPYSPFLPVAALTPPAHSTFSTSTESPLFTEYLPKVKLPSGQPLTYDNQLYASLNSHHTESESLSSVRCSVVQLQGSAFESLRVSYGVSCAAPTLFALPISYNPFTTITRVVPGQPDRRMAIVHVATDPRIVIRVPSAGPATYVCQLPTLAGILFGS